MKTYVTFVSIRPILFICGLDSNICLAKPKSSCVCYMKISVVLAFYVYSRFLQITPTFSFRPCRYGELILDVVVYTFISALYTLTRILPYFNRIRVFSR